MVGAPNTYFECYTHGEALLIFSGLPARAVVLKGPHRCTDDTYLTCSGKSKVCSATNESERYRTSDMAHVTDSHFQVAHEVWRNQEPLGELVTLHGMSSKGVGISNGATDGLPQSSSHQNGRKRLDLVLAAFRIAYAN